MAANTALKKIQARVKQLRKKHPNAKFRTLQKQAGSEYKSGKLKARRKRKVSALSKVAKVGKVRRKKRAVKKARAVRPRVVVIASPRRRARRRAPRKKAVTRRRVSGSGKSMMPLLLLGALGVGAYLLFGRQQQPVYMPTTNPQRNNNAQTIIAAAQAAGLAASAIANIINNLNKANDTQVQAAADKAQAGIVNENDLFPGANFAGYRVN